MHVIWFNFSLVLLFGVVLQCCSALISSWSSSDWLGDSRKLNNLLWDKDYLASKTSVRLIKKSWKPKGLSFDSYEGEFPGTVDEAYTILRKNKDYKHVERPLHKSAELFTVMKNNRKREYDRNLDSIILIHPLFSHGDEGYFTIPTIIALGMRNIHRKYNLFVFHMPVLNVNFFFTILRDVFGFEPHYEEMAEVLTSFIAKGIQQGYWKSYQIHLIGYSYSGNLVGYMARQIKMISDTKVSSIICLDPFSTQYNSKLISIGKDDAEVVHILHTSSYVEGTRERIGTADFVFNDGILQPECVEKKNVLKKLIRLRISGEPFACSHIRVVPRFWYVILFPSFFKARQCDSWSRLVGCLCEEHPDGLISYPIVHRSLQGTFFLKTTGSKPYGLKEEGSHCITEEQKKLEKQKEDIIKYLDYENKPAT